MRKVLALVSDAYGGRGGIALYSRNILYALCRNKHIVEVVAVPRSIAYELEEMPENLRYLSGAAGGNLRYLATCVRLAFSKKKVDLIVCGHLHLLPMAYLLQVVFRCPVVLIVYGVDAWTKTRHRIVNYLCRKLEYFITIRKLTANRFAALAGLKDARYYYLPNCIDEKKYGIGPKRTDLMARYGLEGSRVILTAGRLDSIETEGKKGFDEVLEVLPDLRKEVANIKYLIVGDGDDKARLQKKAKRLGLDDIVVFSGYVTENEKADHYRLADVFAMPGSDPQFDRYPFRFVFLEALACGVPVVGCCFEEESEANDPMAQELIIQVDPNNPMEINKGILKALSYGRPRINPVLYELYYIEFEKRVNALLTDIMHIHSSA